MPSQRNSGKLLTIGIILSVSFLKAENVATLVRSADLVVVGTVYAVTEAPDHVSFDIAIERTLKGKEFPVQLRVEHNWVQKGIVFSSGNEAKLATPRTGVWFLQKIAPQTWNVIPAWGQDGLFSGLSLPAVQTLQTPYQHSASVAVSDQVALEVAAASKAGASAWLIESALEGADGDTLLPALGDMLASGNSTVRALAIAALLRRGEPGAVSALADNWPAINKEEDKTRLLRALSDSFRSQDPNSLTQLAALARRTGSHDLRTAAIQALSALHTSPVLPFLAELLTSDDPAERMKAVFGISAFANNCPPQTPDNLVSMAYLRIPEGGPYKNEETAANFAFRRGTAEEESRLVAYWTAWWDSHTELH